MLIEIATNVYVDHRDVKCVAHYPEEKEEAPPEKRHLFAKRKIVPLIEPKPEEKREYVSVTVWFGDRNGIRTFNMPPQSEKRAINFYQGIVDGVNAAWKKDKRS